MRITTVGYIAFMGYIFVTVFMKYSRVLPFYIFMTAFTTVAVFTVGENNIIVYQPLMLVLLSKYLRRTRGKLAIELNMLTWFVLYSLLSIPLTLLFSGIYVPLVDGGDGYAAFSPQQFTQWMYLAFGYLTYYIVRNAVRYGDINYGKIERAFIIAFAGVIVIGWLQKVLPLSIVNTYFRNSTLVGYDYEGARISSTFGEPSFLALFVTPIIAVLIYRCINEAENRIVNLMMIAAAVMLMVNTNSSSFYFGMGVFILMVIVGARKVENNKMQIIFFLGLLTIAVALPFRSALSNGLQQLFVKLTADSASVSGSRRMYNFTNCIKAFLRSPVLGIGFGTLRGTDMFSRLLAETGIIGSGLLIGYSANMLLKLKRINTDETKRLKILMVISFAIMTISVPDFGFLFIWIYWGAGDGVIWRHHSQAVRCAGREWKGICHNWKSDDCFL